jgi:hypothetical protein
MAPPVSQSQKQDSLAEFVQETARTVTVNSGRLTELETHRGHDLHDRELCNAERRRVEKELLDRMTGMEKANQDLVGTVTRFIEAHDKQSIVDAEARAEAAKLADGNRGRGVQLIGYLLALLGTIIMAWVTYQAHQTQTELPGIVAKAVADALPAAIKAAAH